MIPMALTRRITVHKKKDCEKNNFIRIRKVARLILFMIGSPTLNHQVEHLHIIVIMKKKRWIHLLLGLLFLHHHYYHHLHYSKCDQKLQSDDNFLGSDSDEEFTTPNYD
jgi:hypothetical protein